MSEICAGEPITYVTLDHDDERAIIVVRSFVARGEVFLDDRVGYGFLPTSTAHTALLDADVEGSCWIRGHHRNNSEEVAALLAAYKLVRSAA